MFVGVAGFDRHRDDWTPGAVVGVEQLFAVVRDHTVEGVKAAVGLGNSPGDVLVGVIDCLTKQLRAAAGEVVVRGAAGCATVFEYVGDGRRVGAALADQQGGGDHHPLAGTAHG